MKNTLLVALATLIFAGVACATVNSLPIANTTHTNVTQALPLNRAPQVANEGSPIPYCPPDGCKALPQVANEGSPIPYCPPDGCKALPQVANEGVFAQPELVWGSIYKEGIMTL